MENNSDHINNAHYGSKIKVLRQKHNLTQTDCAKQLGMSTLYFSKIESDNADVNISRLQQIADFFEVPLSTFLATKSTVNDNAIALIKQLQDKLADIDREIISLQRRLILLYDLAKEKKDRSRDNIAGGD